MTMAVDSVGRHLSERPARPALHGQRTPDDTVCGVSKRSRLNLPEIPAASGRRSDAGHASVAITSQFSQSSKSSKSPQSSQTSKSPQYSHSPQSPQSSRSSEVAELSSERSQDSYGTGTAEEPAAETSRQRYDKLFHYFQALDSAAERCPSSTSRSCSPEMSESSPPAANGRPSPNPDAAGDTSGSSVRLVDADGGQKTTFASLPSSLDPAAFAGSEEMPRSIGYAGFVGVPPPQTSGQLEGCVGYPAAADFTCLRSRSPARSRRDRAPRVTRDAKRPRLSGPTGGEEGQVTGGCKVTQNPVPNTSGATSAPVPVSVPAPASAPVSAASAQLRPGYSSADLRRAPPPRRQPVASSAPPPAAGQLWRVPTREEQSAQAAATRRQQPARPTELLSPAAAWHLDFDELMGPCRGDRPLPPRAGRFRHRQPAPSHDTLRVLRERVCLGCTRAFPESNYFDVYYHVNTVYRWFNWKLDA